MSANQSKAGGLSSAGKLVLIGVPAVLGLFLLLWGVSAKFPQWFERQIVAAEVAKVTGVTGDVKPAATHTISPTQASAIVNGGSTRVVSKGCKVNVWTIPWNATMGIHLANGGVNTTEGSLMEKYGVSVRLIRQDMYGAMQAAQLKFAEAVSKGNACPDEGDDMAAFVIIMGDGYPAYAAGIQDKMAKLDDAVQVIGAIGYSHGEDKCMLPREVASDPQKARGSLIGAVMLDGDYDACAVFASVNDIPINPDVKTYDPQAINFVAVDDFNKADQNLIAGYCEDRPVVNKGKLTGEKRHVCQNGTATWTPGDVNVAMKKGGMVAVASTKDFAYQMPAVIIGSRNFMQAHPQLTKGLLRAALEGGEVIQIMGDSALERAGKVEAQVYKAESWQYWAKYYKGVTEKDKLGHPVSLGGSRVIGLPENAFLFGLNGMANLYKDAIYTQFGDHDVKYYPEVMKTYPKYEDVVNTDYLVALFNEVSGATQSAEAAVPTYDASQQITQVVSKRGWHIEFDTGKATIRHGSEQDLRTMLGQIGMSNLKVEVHGYTDDVGSDEVNIPLSKARAEAVKQWLMSYGKSAIPDTRVEVFGHGSSNPIVNGTSAAARQQNRRVEVILGSTG